MYKCNFNDGIVCMIYNNPKFISTVLNIGFLQDMSMLKNLNGENSADFLSPCRPFLSLTKSYITSN